MRGFELKTSSPRPSPPASLGGEGVISRFDILKFKALCVRVTIASRLRRPPQIRHAFHVLRLRKHIQRHDLHEVKDTVRA